MTDEKFQETDKHEVVGDISGNALKEPLWRRLFPSANYAFWFCWIIVLVIVYLPAFVISGPSGGALLDAPVWPQNSGFVGTDQTRFWLITSAILWLASYTGSAEKFHSVMLRVYAGGLLVFCGSFAVYYLILWWM